MRRTKRAEQNVCKTIAVQLAQTIRPDERKRLTKRYAKLKCAVRREVWSIR